MTTEELEPWGKATDSKLVTTIASVDNHPSGKAARALRTVPLLQATRTFNRTSTWLAGAIIFLGIVQIVVAIIRR